MHAFVTALLNRFRIMPNAGENSFWTGYYSHLGSRSELEKEPKPLRARAQMSAEEFYILEEGGLLGSK